MATQSTTYTVEEFRAVVLDLMDVVEKAGEKTGSAFEGLRVTAIAFAAVLDIYAAPNAENPLGMCDDKRAFRSLFADMIVKARKARAGCGRPG